MKRNIKFKAKKLNSCEWVEGDLAHIGNRVCIGGDHLKDGITDVDPYYRLHVHRTDRQERSTYL